MKRIAALAALMLALLAIPSAAVASSGSSGSGLGPPRTIQVVCPLPFRLIKGHHEFRIVAKGKLIRISAKLPTKVILRLLRHGRKERVTLGCRFLPGPPFCRGPVIRFDMASGSSTLTELSGPILSPPEEFFYDGNTYTIMSVNPGADSFTVFLNGLLFVNHGAPITNGAGLMACGH